MFSRRTSWEIKANKITRLLNELKNNNRRLIDLTESNPTLVELNYELNNVLEPLVNVENLKYNPDPRGLIDARKAICKYYEEKEVKLNPDDIILTSGSSEAYNYIFRLITEPGDEILVPAPSYPLLQHLADLNDIRIRYYRLNYDGEWHIDLDMLKNSVSEKTKIIVCINPNNPIGAYIKSFEYDQIVDLAKEKRVVILSDEVFWDYNIIESTEIFRSFSGCKDTPTFVLNGVSKLLALPQMKLGWIIVNGSGDFKEEALSKLEIISDTFLSVNIPAQNALPVWLTCMKQIQLEIRNRLVSNYNYLRSSIVNSLPIQIYRVEGGWSSILRLPNVLKDDEWVELLLRECGVFVHPGYYFDIEVDSCIVLSLLIKPELFREGVERIIEQVSNILRE